MHLTMVRKKTIIWYGHFQDYILRFYNMAARNMSMMSRRKKEIWGKEWKEKRKALKRKLRRERIGPRKKLLLILAGSLAVLEYVVKIGLP